jgi:hypothetical protein
VYARRVRNEVLDFGHRGWLYEESFLFYDRQTDSLWVQATGQAVRGPYRGVRLERLPATHTTWSQWRQLYPQTQALGRLAGHTFRYWEDRYARYYATGEGVRYKRKAPLGIGLAVLAPGGEKLYPFRELTKAPVLADRLGDEPVVVVYHDTGRTGVAFDRRHQGRELTFELAELRAADVLLKDRQTGSVWSGLTGWCLEGPAKGAQLRQLLTTQFVVENWPLHYPKGMVYQASPADAF